MRRALARGGPPQLVLQLEAMKSCRDWEAKMTLQAVSLESQVKMLGLIHANPLMIMQRGLKWPQLAISLLIHKLLLST